jgi:hypothetical protein
MLKQSKSTVLTIANATALASSIVHEIAGNEVANTLNGKPVNKSALADLIGSRVHANFSNYTSKATQS